MMSVTLMTIVKFLSSRHIINILSKSKILYIYNNQEEAKKQMYKDAKNSKRMYVFANIEPLIATITNEFYELLKEKKGDIKIMFADSKLSSIKQRQDELNFILAPETNEGFIRTIINIQQTNSNVQFLLHNEFIRNKFYIFDDIMYLGFRSREKISEKTEIWRIKKDSYLYIAFLQQFEDYWKKYSIE
jgi:hypothetical protein